MTGFYGVNGETLIPESGLRTSNYKKAKAPALGEAFGNWAGRELDYLKLPGGGLVQFDLNRLSLSDFRQMTTHYQVNSSLSVLSFMLHQAQWRIECDNKKIAAHCEENLSNVWTRLVRAMSQAFWAGYSPSVLQWENDVQGRTIQLTKIKDLAPEEAYVNWKKVEGAPGVGAENSMRPKIKVYDGIKQVGYPGHIPTECTFWYPLLMENGDYRGRKLLKSAFQPWFFSTLMHLFSNRYFERFGEPVPVGRAPLDEVVADPISGEEMQSNKYMMSVLQRVRSRAAVVLPSDKIMDKSGDPTESFEYDIKYLESQMRGADFERYMLRLDEEISLALFTPLLLMRGGEGGSLNLGTAHMQMYQWQLNAITGDWAEYINKYILAPMADFNFGTKSARPRIKFQQMGKTQSETNRAVLAAMVNAGSVRPDIVELGQAVGLTLEEIRVVSDNEEKPKIDKRVARVRDGQNPDSVADKITARIAGQAKKAFANGTFSTTWIPDFGYGSKVPADQIDRLEKWNDDLLQDGLFASAEEYLEIFEAGVKDILSE